MMMTPERAGESTSQEPADELPIVKPTYVELEALLDEVCSELSHIRQELDATNVLEVDSETLHKAARKIEQRYGVRVSDNDWREFLAESPLGPRIKERLRKLSESRLGKERESPPGTVTARPELAPSRRVEPPVLRIVIWLSMVAAAALAFLGATIFSVTAATVCLLGLICQAQYRSHIGSATRTLLG